MKLATVAFLAAVLLGSLGSQVFPGEPRTPLRSHAAPSLPGSAPPSIFEHGHGRHHPNHALIRRRHRFVPHYEIIYILPHRSVVITSPYYCTDHDRGFVSRAGFLDHVSGTHKISLENSLAFCSEGGSSCAFPGF